MRRLAVAAAMAGLGLGACVHRQDTRETMMLDSLLAFSDPRTCETTPAHSRFLEAMIAGDANAGFHAGRVVAPRALRPAFGTIRVDRHDGWWTIGVPVDGTLFGLPLRRIDHALPDGGDPGDVTYRFDAPVEAVERALRARGFPAKAGKDVSLGPPDGMDHHMSLMPDPENPRRSLFGCGYL